MLIALSSNKGSGKPGHALESLGKCVYAISTVKPVLSGHSKEVPKICIQDR